MEIQTAWDRQKMARIIGALFLVSYAGVFVGAMLTERVLGQPDFLLNAYPDRAELWIGVLVELLNDVAIVGIAVLFFPFFRKYGTGLALGYIGLRILEATFLIIFKLGSLSYIGLSQSAIEAGASGAVAYERLGELVASVQDATAQLGTIFLMLGAVILYYLLLRSELVPRFIPIWGLLAIAALIIPTALGTPDLTQEFEPAALLFFPIVFNELFLAGWLLVKGFNPERLEVQREEPELAHA